MKTLLILLASLSASLQLFAQTPLAQAKKSGSNNWGYINPQGEFAIPAQYSDCHPFGADGLAAIYDKKAKTFYFIKPDGSKLDTEVEKFRLQNIFGFGTKGFSEGVVAIQVGKVWGYMNTDGKMLAPVKYDKALEFNSGFGVAQTGGKFSLVSKEGKEMAVEVADIEDLRHFSEGLAPLRIGDLWGFLSTDGKVAVDAQFKAVGYFSGGLAWAKTQEGTVGYIDKSGAWVIPAKFDAAKDFSEERARVKSGDSWTFVDPSGKIISTPSVNTLGDFSNGLAYAKTDGTVGFVDKSGKLVIDQKFSAVRDFKNGYAAAKQGDLWGFIDIKGNWAIEPQFESVKDFESAQ